jgi:hypothetical protein
MIMITIGHSWKGKSMRFYRCTGMHAHTHTHTHTTHTYTHFLGYIPSTTYELHSFPYFFFPGLYPGMRIAVASSADTPFAEKVGRKAWLITSVD